MKLLLYGVASLMLFFTSSSFFSPSNAHAIPSLNRTYTSFSSSPSTTLTKTTALVPGNCPCGRVRVVFDDDKEIIGVDRRICKDKNGTNLDSLMQLESAKFCYYQISLYVCGGLFAKSICGSYSGHYIQQDFNQLHDKFVPQSQNHTHQLYVSTSEVSAKTYCEIRSFKCKALFTRGIVDFVNNTWTDVFGNPISFSGDQKDDFDNFVAHVSKLQNAYGVVLPRSVKNEIHFSQEVLQLGQLDPSTEPLTTTVSASTSTVPSTTPAEMSSCPACPVCQVCPSGTPAVASAQPGLGAQGGEGGSSEKGKETSSSTGIDFWLLVIGLIIFVLISFGLAAFIFKKRGFSRMPREINKHIKYEKKQEKRIDEQSQLNLKLIQDNKDLLTEIKELRENDGNKKEATPNQDPEAAAKHIRNKKAIEFRQKCLKGIREKKERQKVTDLAKSLDSEIQLRDNRIQELEELLKDSQLKLAGRDHEIAALKQDNDETDATTTTVMGTPSTYTAPANVNDASITAAPTTAASTTAASTAPPE